MIENEKCALCSKKDECQGKIVSLFSFIQNKIYQHYENKFGESVLFVYRENIQEIYYAAFFYLMKHWTFSQGENKEYTEFLREEYPNEPLSSGELSSNALYKSRKRYLEKVSALHNEPFANYWNINEENFKLLEFILRYRKNRKTKDNDLADEKINHSRIFKTDIFSKMYEYSIPKGHKYTKTDFYDDMNNIQCIYDDIEKTSDSYFDKCLKYEIVEYKLHYETAYKFSSTLERKYSFLSEENKYKALQYESVLRHVKTYNLDKELYLNEFPVLANMALWIDMFFKNFTENFQRPLICAELFLSLTNHIESVMNQCYLSMQDSFPEFRISECGFAENIFKNYIGEGQHITKDKDLTKKILQDIWTIFDKSEYID